MSEHGLNQLERDEILLQAGVAGAAAPATFGAMVQLLADRYSCRGFRSEPVPRETVERLLAAAQLTPSWCNTQPWHVHVTDGEGTERFRQALHAHVSGQTAPPATDFDFPQSYSGVFLARRRETAWRLYDCVGVKKGDRAASREQSLENYRLFGAPHVMILTTERELGAYGALDCGIFVGNVLALAQSLGLGAIPQAALASVSPFVRDYFGLPQNRMVLCAISFGYADDAHPANGFRTARSPGASAMTWIDN